MLEPMPQFDTNDLLEWFADDWTDRAAELLSYVKARSVIKHGQRPKQEPIAELDKLLLEIYEQFNLQVKADREGADIRSDVGNIPILFNGM